MNSFTNLLKERYSCRRYLSKDIPDENIEKILYDATLAPSTNNRQPWTFTVLKNKEIISKISIMLREAGLEKDDPAIVKTAQAIYEAPVLICVFNKEVNDESISIIQSIGACIENMLLSATELKINSLWIRATYCIEKDLERRNENEIPEAIWNHTCNFLCRRIT